MNKHDYQILTIEELIYPLRHTQLFLNFSFIPATNVYARTYQR